MLIHALVPPGAAVAVEDPTGMRLLDILEDHGVRVLTVRCDSEGPIASSLETAMAFRPVAFLFQPRLHSVTGQTVSNARMEQLARILRNTDTLIVEDDGVADISAAPRHSLGSFYPDRVIHIVSYSKTHGPDLRLAVLSSTRAIIDQIQSYRSFSAGWTSRILQSAVAWLLNDPATDEMLSVARQTYFQRRADLIDALGERGIEAAHGAGLCAWVPVTSEPSAIVTLAARNIAAHPGTKFSFSPQGYLRVATGNLTHRCSEVADAIALAAVYQ
jgi:DNA-binding transcriptional MocR family regulator